LPEIKLNKPLLKAYMKEKDLNITEMAKKMGINRSYLSDVLNNDVKIGEKFISSALKVTLYGFNELFFLKNMSHKYNDNKRVPERGKRIIK